MALTNTEKGILGALVIGFGNIAEILDSVTKINESVMRLGIAWPNYLFWVTVGVIAIGYVISTTSAYRRLASRHVATKKYIIGAAVLGLGGGIFAINLYAIPKLG